MLKAIAGIIVTGTVVGFILWSFSRGARPPTTNPYGCSACARYCPLEPVMAAK